jgi:hypothetical protein
MYKLSVFRHLVHYILGRAVTTYDFTAVFGIWLHLCLLYQGSQELRMYPAFSPCRGSLFQLKFFLHKTRIF